MFDYILKILLSSYIDRARGDKFGPSKTFDLFLYGMLVSSIVGSESLAASLLCVPLFMLGGSTGLSVMGYYLNKLPLGANSDSWWEKKLARDKTFIAVCVRGLLWAIPVTPLIYFDAKFIALVVGIQVGFVLALVVTRILKYSNTKLVNRLVTKYVGEELNLENEMEPSWWGLTEHIRGMLISSITVVLLFLM